MTIDHIKRGPQARIGVSGYANWQYGENYVGAELLPYEGRPNANDSLELPSRIGDKLHYRDGRIEPCNHK